MIHRRKAFLALTCALPASLAARVQEASFPPSMVTNVVPVGVGSASDTLARLFSQRLSEAWKTSVVVDNRPGANGIPATAYAAKAPGDGSLLLWVASNHVINEALYPNLPYRGLKDFRPVANVAYVPLILCVPASSPASNLDQLRKLAGAKPGALNFGSAGAGSTSHLAGELFKRAAKIDIAHIPYKQIQQAATDLIAGTLDMLFLPPSSAMGQIRGGRIKAIGAASLQRLSIAPDMPTLAESGLPGFEVQSFLGVLVPASVPEGVVERMSADFVRIASSPDIHAEIIRTGLIPAPLPHKDFSKLVERESLMWSRIVQQSGAKPE